MKTARIFRSLVSLVAALSSVLAFANGGANGGGGDAVVQDFMRALGNATSWLILNPSSLPQGVTIGDFANALHVDQITSQEEAVLDETVSPPVIKDCYFDASRDHLKINRGRWISLTEEMKVRLAAHENFRKLGVNDDQYQISRNIGVGTSSAVAGAQYFGGRIYLNPDGSVSIVDPSYRRANQEWRITNTSHYGVCKLLGSRKYVAQFSKISGASDIIVQLNTDGSFYQYTRGTWYLTQIDCK